MSGYRRVLDVITVDTTSPDTGDSTDTTDTTADTTDTSADFYNATEPHSLDSSFTTEPTKSIEAETITAIVVLTVVKVKRCKSEPVTNASITTVADFDDVV